MVINTHQNLWAGNCFEPPQKQQLLPRTSLVNSFDCFPSQVLITQNCKITTATKYIKIFGQFLLIKFLKDLYVEGSHCTITIHLMTSGKFALLTIISNLCLCLNLTFNLLIIKHTKLQDAKWMILDNLRCNQRKKGKKNRRVIEPRS